MKHARDATAGTTLIEMLLALAVSAMIGLAGFVLLESTLRTQSGVSGELDRLAHQQRAFRLFSADVTSALSARMPDAQTLELQHFGYTSRWSVSDEAVLRRLAFPDRAPLTQLLLREGASFEDQDARAVTLRFETVWRVVALPETPAS